MSEDNVVVKKAFVPKLGVGRLQRDGHDFNRHVAKIAAETDKKWILNPAFWAHYAHTLASDDEIIAIREDKTWKVRLHVLYKNGNDVHVVVEKPGADGFIDLAEDGAAIDAAGGYFLKHRGRGKWGVLNAGGDWIKDDFGTKQEAETFLRTLAKAA